MAFTEFPTPGAFAAAYREGAGASTGMLALTGAFAAAYKEGAAISESDLKKTTEGGADLRLLQRPCRTRDDASPHDGGLRSAVHLVVPGAGASGRQATIGKRTDP